MNNENMRNFKIDLRNTNTEELTLLFKILTNDGNVHRRSLDYFLNYRRSEWELLKYSCGSWGGDKYINIVNRRKILSVKEFCDKFYKPQNLNTEEYITPYDLFNGNIKKGTIYKLTDAFDNNTLYYPEGHSQLSIYCLPSEIVTTWEKYYNKTNITYDDVDESSNIIYHVTTISNGYKLEWLCLRNMCKINDKQLESHHYCITRNTGYFNSSTILTDVRNITSIRKATKEECDFLINKIVEYNKTVK